MEQIYIITRVNFSGQKHERLFKAHLLFLTPFAAA